MDLSDVFTEDWLQAQTALSWVEDRWGYGTIGGSCGGQRWLWKCSCRLYSQNAEYFGEQ